ncbi:hypothetical protein GPLA_0689 [Paraglaciecola polaris LMG 21857]|uniref:Uncharacterized protein n=1 Tax=Paraglaciecola polaris LMG 21857 TaxID=1129793 RepID=K7A829_9ALTE|nr:hypothetical protein GPLA_0689 [Paraglaciecola polaris LMG 21857]
MNGIVLGVKKNKGYGYPIMNHLVCSLLVFSKFSERHVN